MACCKALEKKNGKLTTLLEDYYTLLAEQDVLKKDDMLSAVVATVAFFRKGKENLMGDNKSLTLINAELVSNSKNVLIIANASKHEKLRTWSQINFSLLLGTWNIKLCCA